MRARKVHCLQLGLKEAKSNRNIPPADLFRASFSTTDSLLFHFMLLRPFYLHVSHSPFMLHHQTFILCLIGLEFFFPPWLFSLSPSTPSALHLALPGKSGPRKWQISISDSSTQTAQEGFPLSQGCW